MWDKPEEGQEPKEETVVASEETPVPEPVVEAEPVEEESTYVEPHHLPSGGGLRLAGAEAPPQVISMPAGTLVFADTIYVPPVVVPVAPPALPQEPFELSHGEQPRPSFVVRG